MNKNLPKVFAVPIDKKISNNENLFRSSKTEIKKDPVSISEINKIFNSKNYVYKTRVTITTKDKKEEIDVIGLKSDNLLTMDGRSIPISEIYEIKKV